MGERSGARGKDSIQGGRGAVLKEADPERSLLCSGLFCSFADPSSPAAALSNRKRHHLGLVLWFLMVMGGLAVTSQAPVHVRIFHRSVCTKEGLNSGFTQWGGAETG